MAVPSIRPTGGTWRRPVQPLTPWAWTSCCSYRAALPPHKALPAGTPPAQERLRLTEIAADTLLLPKQVEVSSLELERPGKSYTADTLRQLRGQYPDAQLWLLVGTDMFLSLQTWREPETIMALAGICAFSRAHADRDAAFAAQAELLQKTYGAQVRVIHQPEIVEISSTQLRERLAKGEGQEYLPRRYTATFCAGGCTAFRQT